MVRIHLVVCLQIQAACASLEWLLERLFIEAKSSTLSLVTNANVTFDSIIMVSMAVFLENIVS